MKLGLSLGVSASARFDAQTTVNLLVIGDSLAERIQTKGGDELDTVLESYFETVNRNNVAIAGIRSFKYIADAYTGDYVYDTTGNAFSTAFTSEESSNSVTASDYETCVLWLGTNDTVSGEEAGFDRTDYKSKLEELIQAVKDRYTNIENIILMPLNRKDTSPAFADVQYQEIKEIQAEIAAVDSVITLGPVVYDTDMQDGVHPSDAEFESTVSPRVGRFVAAVNGKRSLTGIQGPIINTATFNGFEIDLDITHDGGSDITVPSGAENFFAYEDATTVRPVPSRIDATTIQLDLESTGARIDDGTIQAYSAYGQLDALSVTSPEVPCDSAGLPLRSSKPTMTNDDPISQLTDLVSLMRPYVGTKTYDTGALVTTVTDMNGGSWSAGTDRYPTYDATAFDDRGGLIVTDTATSMRYNSAITGNQARMIGLVVEFPASNGGNVYIAGIGNGTTARFDAGLVLNSSGVLSWFYDDSGSSSETVATGVFGTRAVILLDIKSASDMDIYYNSSTPINIDPDDQAFAQTYAWIMAQSHTGSSAADMVYGDVFVKESAHSGSDPTIADILEYLNLRYNVGLSD